MRGGKVVAAPARRPSRRAGDRPAPSAAATRKPEAQRAVTVEEPSELSEYRYCTSFLITGDAIDREAFEAFLLPLLGDSALVVGDERTAKVHVHVNDPGVVLTRRSSTALSVTSRSTTCTRRARDGRRAARRRRRKWGRAAPSSWRSWPAPATSSSSETSAATRSSTAASP